MDTLSPASTDSKPVGDGPHVTLGEHTYPVYAQRIGYLENRLGSTLGQLVEANFDSGSIIGFLGKSGYDVLRVFIPRLMPEWQFRGYRSESDFEQGNYDAEADAGVTLPEVITAFEVVMKVNRFDLFKHVGKLIDPDLLRGLMNATVAERLTGGGSLIESATTTPPTTSTPSSPTSQTSTENPDSPSPESTA
jgi:hypothetical protein